MSQINSSQVSELSENLIRHMVLSSILSYKKKFSGEYGEMIFCTDDRNYWRKQVFPYYKANRKKMRDASKYDWNLIFNTLNKIRDEIKEIFPYVVIQVEGAEADDIIGTMVRYSQEKTISNNTLVPETEKVLILSGDKDFVQLQKYPNVKQYSPMMKKYITTDDPKKTLVEHIFKGDSGDGIPNVLSQDSVFVTDGVRQKPLRKDKIQIWMDLDNPELIGDDNILRNYKRNEQLIDLDFTPINIQKNIIDCYESGPIGEKRKLLNYFIKNKLKYLFESISEF